MFKEPVVQIDEVFPQIKIDGKELRLKKMEFKLFIFLFDNRNRICTYDMLLDRVWSSRSDVSQGNLSVLIGDLRKKLIGTAVEGKIETVRGFGYRLNCNE